MTKLRIGIDFGYRYTGVAVLAPGDVARLRVVKHRGDISEKLLQRRQNRSARRRNKTRAARLRNFRTLLAGLGLSPRQMRGKKGGKKPNMDFIGNQLYALAHRRGWDYSTLTELLIDGEGKKTATVREIDKLLTDKYGAQTREETRHVKGKQYTRRILVVNGEEQTCLGELAWLWRDIVKLQKDIDKLESKRQQSQPKKVADKLANDIATAERELTESASKYNELTEWLDNADNGKIAKWLAKRLEICGIAEEKRDDAVKEIIIVRLGLDSGEKLGDSGSLYTPHRNRHRDEFVRELQDMMERALSDSSAAEKLAANAKARKISVESAKAQWINNAVAIMDPNNPARKKNKGKRQRTRDIRPPRFDNRHIGKCPVKLAEGETRACKTSTKLTQADNERCWCNLPKKANPAVRRLQFEIEARQMNVKDKNGGERKFTDDEIAELMACADFANHDNNGKPAPRLVNGGADFRAFFAKHKTPPVKGEARGKKDILKDIAEGAQSGRASLCQAHLRQKLRLIKAPQTESEAWQNLHGERRLNICDNDGAPSVRQKVQRVISTLKAMLKDAGYDGRHPAPIEHIGIETARFDISALAQNEGKKIKSAKGYQSKSGRALADLRRQQGDMCLYCGNQMGRDATVDHFIAKARRGSDRELNRVAAHLICNINKGKAMMQPREEVLRYMERQGGEDAMRKAAHIRKMSEGGAQPNDSLAGAQHTMLGAKLLKGSLISAFGIKGDAKVFPPVNPREVAQLRLIWFPLIDKQKRILRAQSGKNKQHKGTPVETFHHAIDAVICAAKVNWRELTSGIDGSLQPGSDEYMRRFEAIAKAKMPKMALAQTSGGDYIVPPERAFLTTDKGRKDGARRAKTGTEPLNCKNEKQVRQRRALYAIAEKNVGNIVHPRMRGLMKAAFDRINKMPKEKRDKFLQDGCIVKEYFLTLEKDDPLHPTNARAALYGIKEVSRRQMWAVADKKGKARNNQSGARHYFKREVAWQRAVIYEQTEDGGKKPKRHILLTPEEFYRNRANAGLFADVPEGAKVVAHFFRGDTVTVSDKRGKWRIAEVQKKGVVLEPLDDDARAECGGKAEMEKSYNKLIKARR